MMQGNKILQADVCVIGGGSGGLSVAAGASQMGAKVILIEKGKMGGDCLNYGCVPSKALLAAGHVAETCRRSDRFGVLVNKPVIDFQQVHDHVHGVIAGIAPHDSVERFEGFGVTVVQGHAKFVDRRSVVAGGNIIRAKKFVISTGSSAAIPPIQDLETVPYFTNETIFDLSTAPQHLVIIGGGAIGCEMAQAYRRLGCEVTLLEMFQILPKDDPELVEVVRTRLIDEGINLRENVSVISVSKVRGGNEFLICTEDKRLDKIRGTHLMIAAGRKPNVDGLGLEQAGIRYSRGGIEVDSRLRTSNKNVFAIGDVAGGLQFTHVAGYHAGIVIRNALFKLPAKANHAYVPWVTYTDPELAQVGLSEETARRRHGDSIRVVRWPYDENDRARTELESAGMVKVITAKNGLILGVGIVGAHAGELLQPWILALNQKLKIGAMAGIIAPYPTLGEINKRAAGAYFTPSLFSDRTRRIVKFLMSW